MNIIYICSTCGKVCMDVTKYLTQKFLFIQQNILTIGIRSNYVIRLIYNIIKYQNYQISKLISNIKLAFTSWHIVLLDCNYIKDSIFTAIIRSRDSFPLRRPRKSELQLKVSFLSIPYLCIMIMLILTFNKTFLFVYCS